MTRTLETKTTAGLEADLARIDGLLARARPDSETNSLSTSIINTQVESLKRQRAAIQAALDGRSGLDLNVPVSGTGGAGPDLPDAAADRIQKVIAALTLQADQLARTGAEQAAYNALVQAGIDENHSMAPAVMGAASALFEKQAAAKAAANALAETNKRIEATRALAKDALTSFIADLRAGESAADSLGNAIGRIGDKLLDVGLNAAIGALFPSPISAAVPFFHSGGTGAEPSGYRNVPAALFAGAPRFHSGIGPGEQAAIIRKDEGVFTPGQMRALGGSGGSRVTNQYISVSGTGDVDLLAKVKAAAAEGARKTSQDEIRQYDNRLPDRVAQISGDPRAR